MVPETAIPILHREVSSSCGNDSLPPLSQLLWRTVRIIIPADISSFLWIVSQTITLMFVGQYHAQQGMAQYSAAIYTFNLFGMSVIAGFGSAIDTISSQVFGRDPTSAEIGETLQRALILNSIVACLISVFFMTCTPLLVLVFGEETGHGAGEFLKHAPPYLMAYIVTGVSSKTLYAQRLPELVTVANLAGALVSPLANHLLTPHGVPWAALALACSVGTTALVYAALFMFHPRVVVRNARWPSPRLLEWEPWAAFVRIGVPSLVAVCAEWWAFELQGMIAAQISPLAIAVHGVAANLNALLFSIALGISVSASVMVGNALGSMQPCRAKQCTYLVIGLDVVVGLCAICGVLLFSRHIAGFFSSDEVVVYAVDEIMPYVVLVHFGDSLQFCLQGVYRGAGRPKQAAMAVLGTLWLIGFPASAFFALYLEWGVQGVLLGLLTGFAAEIPLLLFLMSRWDWHALVVEAQSVCGLPSEEVSIQVEES